MKNELTLSTALRTKRGMRSLREIAKETGISMATLSRLERGEMPSVPTYHRILAWIEPKPEPEQPMTIAQQHVGIDRIAEDLRRQLHDMLRADDNARALASHWQQVANDQRKEIERLKGERDEAQAALATVLDLWQGFVSTFIDALEQFENNRH